MFLFLSVLSFKYPYGRKDSIASQIQILYTFGIQ